MAVVAARLDAPEGTSQSLPDLLQPPRLQLQIRLEELKLYIPRSIRVFRRARPCAGKQFKCLFVPAPGRQLEASLRAAYIRHSGKR